MRGDTLSNKKTILCAHKQSSSHAAQLFYDFMKENIYTEMSKSINTDILPQESILYNFQMLQAPNGNRLQ